MGGRARADQAEFVADDSAAMITTLPGATRVVDAQSSNLGPTSGLFEEVARACAAAGPRLASSARAAGSRRS